MKRILIGAALFSVSMISMASGDLLTEFKDESSESIHKEFFMGKGFAEIESGNKKVLRYDDPQNSFTFVLIDDKVVDAYKVKK
jgi:hypothetical protein